MATMRYFDSKTIRILQEKYSWIVYNPVQLVREAINKDEKTPLLGKNGIIRKTCLEYVDKSSIVVAYTGLIWDTGTAREIEYAIMRDKPILVWSDSSVVYAETFEKKNGTISEREPEKLKTTALPFNAMDLVFDKYVRLNKLYVKKQKKLYDYYLDEQNLAEILNAEATEILQKRS